MNFKEDAFKRQRNYCFTQGFQSVYAFALVWFANKYLTPTPHPFWLILIFAIMCASATMLLGLALMSYRTACLKRALTEFPNHPLWIHETYNTIMFRPDYLKTWTWKQWEKAMKESQ